MNDFEKKIIEELKLALEYQEPTGDYAQWLMGISLPPPVSDGSYFGKITLAELVERDSNFTDNGKQIVLNIRTEVIDNNGDSVELYYSVNYTWSNKGRMVKFLEKLELLPAPGETLELDTLVGLSVQVIIENVIKENVTYSNIVSMKRREARQYTEQSFQQPERSLPDMLQNKQQFDIDEYLDIN